MNNLNNLIPNYYIIYNKMVKKKIKFINILLIY